MNEWMNEWMNEVFIKHLKANTFPYSLNKQDYKLIDIWLLVPSFTAFGTFIFVKFWHRFTCPCLSVSSYIFVSTHLHEVTCLKPLLRGFYYNINILLLLIFCTSTVIRFVCLQLNSDIPHANLLVRIGNTFYIYIWWLVRVCQFAYRLNSLAFPTKFKKATLYKANGETL